jgi:lysophospholipase L1-like esterase
MHRKIQLPKPGRQFSEHIVQAKGHNQKDMKSTAAFTLFLLLATPLAASDPPITYLALGDSVSFGMNGALVPPYTTAVPTPSEFIGFPTTLSYIVPPFSPNNLVNASCPGETSASFLNTSAPDNGCNSDHIVYPPPGSGLQEIKLPPFKTTVGLHVPYTSSQLAYAATQLDAGNHVGLVTLMIGANDVLLVLPQLEACGTSTACAEGVLTPVLANYATNLAQILGGLRHLYSGKLVLVTYYSPTSALNTVAQALNSTMTAVAANFRNIIIADSYTPFQLLSAPFGGDPCRAGLLIKLPANPYNTSACDVHPSPLGRDLIAAAVDFALLFKH